MIYFERGKDLKLTRNVFTIADLVKWLDETSLIVNREYQRGQGLWPINARSYFIDTILHGFPFPKVTIRQTIDLKTRKSVREIIDGQQRIMTIYDFVQNKLRLSSVSKEYRSYDFSDLSDEEQERFLAYEVSIDTIIAASEEEVLEVFRRMNSYTLPLNDQEKRHATYQGEFKWFIKDMIDLYVPLFDKYKILTVRQISRMADADLMTELCQILMEGIESRTSSKLDALYKKNDRQFENKAVVERRLRETIDFIKIELNPVCKSRVLKGYSFYSLFAALVYNKWGIVNITEEDVDDKETIGVFARNINKANQNILELFMSVDLEDEEGNYAEFVKASTSTTHSLKNRMIRLEWLIKVLQS